MSINKFRVYIAALTHFTADFYAGWIAPIVYFLVKKDSLTLTQAGMLIGVFGITSNLTQPIAGILNDRRPSRYYMVIGTLLSSIFISSIGWANNHITILFILVFLGSIGVGLPHPVGATAIAHVPYNERGRAMSFFTSFGHAGFLASPPLVMLVVNQFGFESIVYFMPLGIIVAILVMALKGLDVRPEYNLHIKELFNLILQRKKLLFPLWFIAMCRALVATIVISFVLIFLSFRGDSSAVLYIVIPLFGTCGLLGNLFGGPISDKVGKRKVIFVSMILAAVSLFGFLYLRGAVSLIFLGLMGFFLFSTLPTVIVAAQHIVPEFVGTISSLMMGLTFIIGGIFAPVFGKTVEMLGKQWDSEYFGLLGGYYLLIIPIIFAGLLAFSLPANEEKWAQTE